MKINRDGKKSGKNPTTKSKNDEKYYIFYMFIHHFNG